VKWEHATEFEGAAASIPPLFIAMNQARAGIPASAFGILRGQYETVRRSSMRICAVFSAVVLSTMWGWQSHSESLAAWLTETVDSAFVRSTLEDDAFRLALHEATEELAAGYRVEDLDACRQQFLESRIPQVLAERGQEGPHRIVPGPDALGMFKQAVVMALYAPGYEHVGPDELAGQIESLVDTLLEGVHERYPGVLDAAMEEQLTERWAGWMFDRVDNCLTPAFKVPLDSDAFEALRDEVRTAPVGQGAEIVDTLLGRPDLAQGGDLPANLDDAPARVQGLRKRAEGAPGGISSEIRSGTMPTLQRIQRVYHTQAATVLGPVDRSLLDEKLEAAGLDPRAAVRWPS